MIVLAVICFILVSVFLFYFVVFRYGYLRIQSNVCLIGTTALVTGGSSGIGYQIVLRLASRGCRVIIADKIVEDSIKKAITDETDNPNIILEYVDFASFISIRQFAEKIKKTEKKLDILINNVGIAKSFDKTIDGLDMTMQINYYSPFLLTHLLVDLLKRSENGRIIFTSSILSYIHVMTRSSVTPTNIKGLPFLLRAFDYNNSKFCTVASSRIFAEKLEKWNITCNTYHPGVVNTEIWNQGLSNVNYHQIIDVVLFYSSLLLVILFGVSPKKASQTAVELAISKDFKKISGIFFGKYFPNFLPRLSSNHAMCLSIFKATEKIVQLKSEEML